MKKSSIRLLACVFSLALCLCSACTDDGTDYVQVTKDDILAIAGNASDGPVEGAKVALVDSLGRSWVTSALTDATGAFRISIPDEAKPPVRVRIYGGGCDNSTNPCTPFLGEYWSLIPTVTNGSATGHATPLTTLIYYVAMARAGGNPEDITETGYNAAASIATSLYGMALDFNPQTTPPTVQTGQNPNQDTFEMMVAYRAAVNFLLHVVENGAAGTDADINQVLMALALDLMDGTVDGHVTGVSQDLIDAMGVSQAFLNMLGDFGQRFAARAGELGNPADLQAALNAAADALKKEGGDGVIGDVLVNDTVAALGAQGDNSGAIDRLPKTSAFPVQLAVVGTYDYAPAEAFAEGAAEIVAYDPITKRLFITNAFEPDDKADPNVLIDIVDVSDPAMPVKVDSIDLSGLGAGVNSCAVKNGVVAVAIQAASKQDNGVIGFYSVNGDYLNDVPSGPLPDMVTFSPDGNKVLVANEGEPNDAYTNDPEGSVTIVDISQSVYNPVVTTADFTAFNAQQAALVDAGVRIFGPGATVAQDLEPEYIAVNADSTKAYVTLQENNAVAEIDLATSTVTGVWPFGYKDHSIAGNGLDASNKDDAINIQTWPVLGMYQPDSIAAYSLGGTTYLVTANEGDSREYDAFDEETEVGDEDLDPTVFPNAATLQENENLGKLKLTNTQGDTDNDGDYDKLYSYGARSFSVWKVCANGVDQVFDSGDQFEQITAKMYPHAFNTTDDEIDFDDRSDNKGPEPEAITVGEINGRTFAFVGLERFGGIMTYDITIPENPIFCHYINNRNMNWDEKDDTTGEPGDMAPEGLVFIPAVDSPTGEPMLACANEVSGTTTLYSISTEPKKAEFAVFTDPHYYDPALGVEGAAFQAYLAQDRKLIAESDALMDATVGAIKAELPNFVLVSGDLTKDGEKASHEGVASALAEIEAMGIKAYVAPGNHDINNPHAFSYEGENTTPLPTVTPEEFATIYEDFGFGEAIARDPNSLTYVAQPNDWTRIISMDSCKYDNNVDHAETSGAFSAETLAWILDQVEGAVDNGYMVIGFMHHGVLEHFTGQSVAEPGSEYVIDDYENVSDALAQAGMKVVFTGHYHANDITRKTVGDDFIFDIETGSTVTWPCPWRTVTLDGANEIMTVATHRIPWIDYDLGGETLSDFAHDYLETGLIGIASVMLQQLYGLDAGTAAAVAPDVAAAFIAHYAGDEAPTQDVLNKIAAFMGDPNTAPLGQTLGTLWTDLNPADNQVEIDLSTGDATNLAQ